MRADGVFDHLVKMGLSSSTCALTLCVFNQRFGRVKGAAYNDQYHGPALQILRSRSEEPGDINIKVLSFWASHAGHNASMGALTGRIVTTLNAATQ